MRFFKVSLIVLVLLLTTSFQVTAGVDVAPWPMYQHDIFQNSHGIEETNDLECPSNTRFYAGIGLQFVYLLPFEEDISRRYSMCPAYKIKERCFACTVGTDNCVYLPLFHGDRNIVQGTKAIVIFCHITNF